MFHMKLIVSIFISLISLTIFAYLPPVEIRCDVKVEIETFPQKIERKGSNPFSWPLGVTEVSSSTPRSFPVILENMSDEPVSGILEVWINDDWCVLGPQGEITLAAGECKKLHFNATAKETAINALYPVHARFTPDGVKKEDAPHPIAIFKYNAANAKIASSMGKIKSSEPITASPEVWAERKALALAAAEQGLKHGTNEEKGCWQLVADNMVYGAGVAYGEHGLIDGAIAFTDGARAIVFQGFAARVETNDGTESPDPIASIREEKGTLRISWSIPDVKQNAAGYPRIADLAVGPASEKPHRIFMGFGNVVEEPKEFWLNATGFELSTRHVGADYANGLSIVQAVDVVPDGLYCDGENNTFALHAHHNATFTFVPSAKGSFDAARRFRAVSGYKQSPGYATLGSRMCLDQWEGDYAKAAKDIQLAAKYGITNSVFVRHDWQCWGYDYRLPEIFPPRGDIKAFTSMREACRNAGILFCLHDNYTDIYPDCNGFSYNLTVFNLDGTPQLAWFNSYRFAQSYRWAPHAIHPWCLRNAKLLKESFDPEAIFIDVLTAHGPFDYLDRNGNFYSKNDTSKSWGHAFEAYRQGFNRPDTVCISEAGQDHLIGVADAGQSDHFQASKLLGGHAKFKDSERTPWHDIVSHGYFVLFAGGLGNRYQEAKWHEGGDAELHGYGSDDYLSNCIIGGRNPMCGGPFSRNAVKTYWLQHDICAKLGKEEFLDLKYEGNIHRQHAFFSNGGEVWVNRQESEDWILENGITLPPYGYYARIGNVESGIIKKDGVRCAMTRSESGVFVDARKPEAPPSSMPITKPLRAEELAANKLRLYISWETKLPHPEYLTFVHICDPNDTFGNIAFYSTIKSGNKILKDIGLHETTIDISVPDDTPAGTYAVRYGAWNPRTFERLPIAGLPLDNVKRGKGGLLKVVRENDKISKVSWQPENERKNLKREHLLGINHAGKAVDFGGIKTDGSFRFKDWTITPLPNTMAFSAEIDIAEFGAAGCKVDRVEAIDPEKTAQPPTWKQNGNILKIECDANAFAYRIHFKDL